jgi:hypothetical protein
MTENPPQKLSPEIASLLSRLRGRIRTYVWIEGIAATLAVLGFAFWIGLALDWLLEPSREVRILGIVLVGLVVLMVIYRSILSRVFARLADTSMAVLLERHFDEFHDSLLTSVELTRDPSHAEAFSPDMLDHTSREAAGQAPKVRLADVFNPRPLVRNVSLAIILIGSIVAFGVMASDALAFYFERIALSEKLWPRTTRLEVEGFPDRSGSVKIARGASLTLQVRADNRQPYEVPERVEIRTWLDDGSQGRYDATRVREAVPGRDDFQEYKHVFKDVFESQTFDVVGGDDRIRGLRLEVVESPEVVEMVLRCEYPPYMGRGPQEIPVTAAMQIPLGTKITIAATANKPLEWAKILDPDGGEPVRIDIRGDSSFEHTLEPLAADRLLYFVLKDTDGIQTAERDRYRLSLGAVVDEAPQVLVSLRGIGTAVTPVARVPFQGKVTDDYGVSRIWHSHQIDESASGESPFTPDATGENEFTVEQALELESLGLKPGQKLMLGVQAEDRYDLGEGPNVGLGQRFLLEVVTPERLRALLENRELQLRQRFEVIYQDMTETRDMMARISFQVDEPDEEEADEEAAESANPDADPDDTVSEADKAAAAAELARQALSRRKLRIVRGLQNVERSSHEVLAVATGFDEIREELINNRVDTEELKSRLKDGIADPLREISGPLMSQLEDQIKELERLADDAEKGPAAFRETLTQADQVLVEMKVVLDRMLELESYNEVLETLREIIAAQKELRERTEKRQRDEALRKLKDL